MTEYIDREKAIEAVKKHSGNESAIIASLVCLPSADVVDYNMYKTVLEKMNEFADKLIKIREFINS